MRALFIVAVPLAVISCRGDASSDKENARAVSPRPTAPVDAWWSDPSRACRRVSLRAELAQRELSPNGRYEILLCRVPMLMLMPGGGSDAPGELLLVDTHGGDVIGQTRLEMVQQMTAARWSEDRVEVGLRADWRLLATPLAASAAAGTAIYYEDKRPRLERLPDGTYRDL